MTSGADERGAPKEFELELRLRNNLLKRRRVQLGLSQRAMAERCGVSFGVYSAYENLHYSPLSSMPGSGNVWRESAARIAFFLGESPEELWPPAVLAVACPRVVRKLGARAALDAAWLRSLPQAASSVDEAYDHTERETIVAEVLDRLPERQADIVRRRFGLGEYGGQEQTLAEVAEAYGLGVERVRQIEARAFLSLRRLHNAAKLAELAADPSAAKGSIRKWSRYEPRRSFYIDPDEDLGERHQLETSRKAAIDKAIDLALGDGEDAVTVPSQERG